MQSPLRGRSATFAESYHGFPISVHVLIDGKGHHEISTGIGFLDHLLELLARYSGFDVVINCEGDLRVDDHHTVDEVGIALGTAIKMALSAGDIRQIHRNGFYLVTMDECLTTVSLDLCGRSSLVCDVKFERESVGALATELIREFLSQLCQRIPMTLIAKSEYGTNDHHKAEGLFKALGRALGKACTHRTE
jgi:imidazoleglycerol-phosphate dehydratase